MLDDARHQVVLDLAHLLGRRSAARRAAQWLGNSLAMPDLHRAAALVQAQQALPPGDPSGGASARMPMQAMFDALVRTAQGRGIEAPALCITGP